MEKNLCNVNLKKYNQKEINILRSNLNYDNLVIPPIPNIKNVIKYENWLELNKDELNNIFDIIRRFKKLNLLNEMEIDDFYKFCYNKSNINI
tara:strand:+ start:65 stop:340 length:276 start_codon:yes stop_codon:yes gene_type:complete